MTHKQAEILLIEDNPNDLELTLRALKKCDLTDHINIVRDGQEAINYIFNANSAENLPSLILLDLKLPKVDGLEVLQKLKSDPKTKLIPVVVLTSSDEQSDILKSYDLGVNSYVTKPLSLAGYTNKIAELACYWLKQNKLPYSK